jgi:hypothetical protein
MQCTKHFLLFFSLIVIHQSTLQSAFDDLQFELELDEPAPPRLPVQENASPKLPTTTKEVVTEDPSIRVDCSDFVFWISSDFECVSMWHSVEKCKMVSISLQDSEYRRISQLKSFDRITVIKAFTQDIQNSLNTLLARAGYKIALCS